jgi:hypothetical protein
VVWKDKQGVQMKLIELNRIEVINHSGYSDQEQGRIFVKRICEDQKIELSYQDDGKTLKIFISDKK